ncbi:hypothetical protein SAMN04488539_1590 [Corynebacterium timonense]|uniref:PH domain-containing protein n=1 Tax=Corynebacterium timonense TaxID=441500 RepID=A0A1H1RWZ9_9CORY|nr:hypothetical protein SAMN04488539_1590 [Corynebacterium timonense]
MRDGEVVLADTCEPTSGLVFPLLESIVLTGVCWIVIGWMDVNPIDPFFRNLVVVVWLVLLVTRFVRPVVAARRRRFLVTNQRVMARSGRGGVDSIPLDHIHSAQRSRAGLTLWVRGYDRPLFYPAVGRAKKVQKVLNGQLKSGRY